MTDHPDQRHGHDPDDLMAWRKAQDATPRGRLESANIAINYWNQQIELAMRQRSLAEAAVDELRASNPELWTDR
jgi:hypothetical protein